MQRHEDHRPNPAAFPACCLLAQEMDASACFCDGRVIGELNVRNATFFEDLVDFTPMACGFKIKTGRCAPTARWRDSSRRKLLTPARTSPPSRSSYPRAAP